MNARDSGCTNGTPLGLLENDHIRLELTGLEHGIAAGLSDKATGFLLADGPYSYRVEQRIDEGRTLLLSGITIQDWRVDSEAGTAKIWGNVGKIEIEHSFVLRRDAPVLEESLTLRNPLDGPVYLDDVAFGFTRAITDEDGFLLPDLKDSIFTAIPYRRDTLRQGVGEYQEFSVEEIIHRRGGYKLRRGDFPNNAFGSEGWVWSYGARACVMARYCQECMSFSLLAPECPGRAPARGTECEPISLRIAGFGKWHGDPEALSPIRAHGRVNLGTNYYILVQGGWKEGYYAFRQLMEQNGHVLPLGFDPPVHWNELYDNPLWWGADNQETRAKYYTRTHMEEEAAKANEIGCESLYLDPGWDTDFASTLWAADRLGELEEFVSAMRSRYGLDVSLHCPLAGWSSPSSYTPEACRMEADGKRIEGSLCSGSRHYLETKAGRLKTLCKAGVVFLMFDGTRYTGPCFDPDHQHPIPYTREAHCRSYLQLTQRVHEEHPDVLIELHDPISAGTVLRYTPSYYLHGLPRSFDENWGFEYMWDPMDDLLSGRAVSLYYYNLAYSAPPIYLHIDLRTDNVHALQFWWYASTCRHLGIGGMHPSRPVWEAHKAAMARYLQLKEYYARGEFYGFGEEVHVHVLPHARSFVVSLFNLSDRVAKKKLAFPLASIGFETGCSYTVEQGVRVAGSEVRIERTLEPRAVAVFEVSPR